MCIRALLSVLFSLQRIFVIIKTVAQHGMPTVSLNLNTINKNSAGLVTVAVTIVHGRCVDTRTTRKRPARQSPLTNSKHDWLASSVKNIALIRDSGRHGDYAQVFHSPAAASA